MPDVRERLPSRARVLALSGRSRNHPDVFDARLPAKDGAQALDLPHANALQQAASRQVPFVGHSDHLSHTCLFEDDLDQPAHGLGAEALSLRVARQGEANLGPLGIRVDADAYVAHQFVGGSDREPELNPGSARKRVEPAHLFNEPSGLMVWLWFPTLIPADNRIVPVALKPV